MRPHRTWLSVSWNFVPDQFRNLDCVPSDGTRYSYLVVFGLISHAKLHTWSIQMFQGKTPVLRFHHLSLLLLLSSHRYLCVRFSHLCFLSCYPEFSHTPGLTNMENSHWATQDSTSEPFDYTYYVDSENPNLLTPPESPDGFQCDDRSNVSVSTTFFPGAHGFPSDPDLILVPSDSVYFYTHSYVLLSMSNNGFNSMLPVLAPQPRGYFGPGPILAVPELSSVFNIVLHVIYDMPCNQYSPSLDTLIEAVSALKTYGVAAKNVITPGTPLYNILLTHAASRPLDLFAFASQNLLDPLAVATSTFLLSFSLCTISDEVAERIGPVYLKRLFFMHLGRAEALRTMLLPPPYPHTPTPTCDAKQQKCLERAWTLASASLAWDGRADLSISKMKATLTPLGDHLLCKQCEVALNERINVLMIRWSLIKRTI